MPATLVLTLTEAGLDALVNAQSGSTANIQITQMGLSDQGFTAAPTLDALPGEFKRVATLSGQSVSETVIHMTAQDSSADTYDLRGFGLYLDDGTLFAAYAQDDPVFRKVEVASFLFSVDVAFADSAADNIDFGDATFLYPPATETVKGVAQIATQEEVDAGLDGERIVTPLTLASVVAAIVGGFTAATEAVEGVIELATQGETDAGTDDERAVTPLKLATLLGAELSSLLQGVSITGEGLASGGGDLTQNRTIQVIAASGAEVSAGVESGKVVTPASLADVLLEIADRALSSVTITGTGIATGGGNLAANREINVATADAADMLAGIAANKVITPAVLGPLQKLNAQNGYILIPSADPANTIMLSWGRFAAANKVTTSVTFPLAFSECYAVVASGTNETSTSSQDMGTTVKTLTITATGFQAFSASDNNDTLSFLAVGRKDMS